MIEERYNGLQQERDTDDIAAKSLEALPHATEASGYGLRVLQLQAFDQLFDDLIVQLEIAVQQYDLEEKSTSIISSPCSVPSVEMQLMEKPALRHTTYFGRVQRKKAQHS